MWKTLKLIKCEWIWFDWPTISTFIGCHFCSELVCWFNSLAIVTAAHNLLQTMTHTIDEASWKQRQYTLTVTLMTGRCNSTDVECHIFPRIVEKGALINHESLNNFIWWTCGIYVVYPRELKRKYFKHCFEKASQVCFLQDL